MVSKFQRKIWIVSKGKYIELGFSWSSCVSQYQGLVFYPKNSNLLEAFRRSSSVDAARVADVVAAEHGAPVAAPDAAPPTRPTPPAADASAPSRLDAAARLRSTANAYAPGELLYLFKSI